MTDRLNCPGGLDAGVFAFTAAARNNDNESRLTPGGGGYGAAILRAEYFAANENERRLPKNDYIRGWQQALPGTPLQNWCFEAAVVAKI